MDSDYDKFRIIVKIWSLDGYHYHQVPLMYGCRSDTLIINRTRMCHLTM